MKKNGFVWIATLVGLVTLGSTLAASHLCPGDPDCEVPFPDNVGPEIWADGPANVQVGTGVSWPHVAVDELGQRIYVWSAGLDIPPNGDRNDIFMRRFDEAGNPLMDPFFVNTYVTNSQTRPRIAVASDGSFLVTWESDEEGLGGGADRIWVRSRAFNADGTPMGSDQLVSTVSPQVPSDAFIDVAALRIPDGSAGGFVVAWLSWTPNGTDTGTNIQARMISPNGAPFGAQFQVNNLTPSSQIGSTVTELADGGFLVVWEDPGLRALQGRRFNAAGGPVANQFQISTTFTGNHRQADVAIGWDGRVAVVWEDEGDVEPEIRSRLYDSDLSALGPDFRVNTVITGDQDAPNVADYGPKGFLVTWESSNSAGNDASFRSVQARLMTDHNTFDGPQIQYNIWTDTNQQEAGSAGWYGRLATGWGSNGNFDTGGAVITGRDIEYCMFCDDFEWGSSWRWTSTLGQAP